MFEFQPAPSRRAFLQAGLAIPTCLLASPFQHVAASVLNSSDFSPPANAAEDGSGLDSTIALQAFCNQLSQGVHKYARIAPGRYRLTKPLSLFSSSLGDLTIDATGAEFVFDIPFPQERVAFLLIGNPACTGGRLSLIGLKLRLNRPAVRTGGSDMVRLFGFEDYHIFDINIPSADNMALSIGRGDPKGWTPRSVIVDGCSFGGRREGLQHSHASIGDTAIWIVTPAEVTRICSCNIRETGDDAIYVGHSESKLVSRVIIRDNRLKDTGVGIGVSVTGAEIIANHIDRTNVCAIRCEKQDGGHGSNALISKNTILRAGQLEAGDIGSQIIEKPHPHAIFIHVPGGNISIIDNLIEGARECAVAVRSHRDGPTRGIYIEGGQYNRIGVDKNDTQMGGRANSAVFRRDGSAPTTVDGFRAVGPTVADTQAPLLLWKASGFQADEEATISGARIIECDLGDTPLVVASARPGAVLGDIAVDYSVERSEIRKPAMVSPSGSRPTIRVRRL